jgi:hypothetical protein
VLPLRWKRIWRKIQDSGVGTAIDLSSGGILFEAEKSLPLGSQVELAIAWPALIANFPPVQVMASGVVVRSDGNRNAIRMVRHEFRTVATAQGSNARPTAEPEVVSIGIH